MKRFVLSLLFAVATLGASAQDVFRYDQSVASTYIDRGISFLEDKEGTLTFDQVKEAGKFTAVKARVPNFGVSSSVYWLKVVIQSNQTLHNYRLQIAQPCLDEIDFYRPGPDGNYQVSKGGEKYPFRVREFFDPSFIYNISLSSDQLNVFYFRVSSRDNFQAPIIIGNSITVFEDNKIKDFVFGIFSGIMVVMFLYNLFIYVTVRDKTYLYYIIYLATVIFTQISIQGYTFQYLWPNNPFMAEWSPFIFSPLVGMAAAYFMRVFLITKQYAPRLDKGFKYFGALYTVAFIFALIGKFDISFQLITVCAFLLSMYMLLVGFTVFRKDYKPARFFLLAWSMFLVGVTVYAMTNLGILPINAFSIYTMPFGAACEVILLSLALADRINALKKEKEESQAEALRVSQQNQKLISEQNVILEQKVHERTLALEQANEDLNVTLTHLKDTQSQLVNAEKMASLGQLTAGIAHEINNPINFVSANLKPLKLDINEIFDVVKKYESLTPDPDMSEKLKEIDAYKKRIDLDYLKQEIGTLLTGIEDGARRTAEIVSGLKNFSRLDESDIKEANINEGIESTLILIRSTIPRNVDVILKLDEIPIIECYPGKLNQVFMNLMTNAIYAVSKKNSKEINRLVISTFEKGEKVYAVFEDTGIGMTKEVKDKIFEPFFTTKDVGEGTGLGMSIVFKIIESHQAKMEVESELGVGTKITLILNKKLELKKEPVQAIVS